MLHPFRPSFEKLENREVFSTAPLIGMSNIGVSAPATERVTIEWAAANPPALQAAREFQAPAILIDFTSAGLRQNVPQPPAITGSYDPATGVFTAEADRESQAPSAHFAYDCLDHDHCLLAARDELFRQLAIQQTTLNSTPASPFLQPLEDVFSLSADRNALRTAFIPAGTADSVGSDHRTAAPNSVQSVRVPDNSTILIGGIKLVRRLAETSNLGMEVTVIE